MVKPTPPTPPAQRPRFDMSRGWGVAMVLTVLLIWVTSALARVDNERYALATGLCKPDPSSLTSLRACLSTVETRTAWYWHVYYALTER